MTKYVLFTILLLILSFTVVSVAAQEDQSSDKKNSSDMFAQAQKLAFEGDRNEARTICYEILNQNPNYHDARILIGRTYAWDKQFDKGRKELEAVLDRDLDNKDAIFAIIDLEKWAEDLSKALFYCDYGLSFYPREEQLLIQKIKILQEHGQEKKSQQILTDLLDSNPESKEGMELFRKQKSLSMRHKAILQHDFEHFSKPYIRRWHVSSMQVSRRNIWGSLIGKINVGDLVSEGESLWSNEIAKQFELDAYPRISASNYMYLSYGYSPDKLFPKHRAGAEWYQKLPAAFEASAGIRFMQFAGSSGEKNVYIYTGSVGKYYRNYWFSFRAYLTPKDKEISQSYWLTTRRYLRDAKQYIGLELGTGVSPDEARGNTANIQIYKYDSQKIRLAYQDQLLKKRLTYLVWLGYEREEYQFNRQRMISTASLKLSYQF